MPGQIAYSPGSLVARGLRVNFSQGRCSLSRASPKPCERFAISPFPTEEVCDVRRLSTRLDQLALVYGASPEDGRCQDKSRSLWSNIHWSARPGTSHPTRTLNIARHTEFHELPSTSNLCPLDKCVCLFRTISNRGRIRSIMRAYSARRQ